MALIGKLRIVESRCERMEKMAQRNGLRHTIRTLNGDTYTGEWKNHLRHGRGTQVWKKAGTMYEGEWRRDLRHGFGTLYKLQPSTGQYLKVYSGYWCDGKREGLGKGFYGSRACYEGGWVADMRSGWGRMEFEDGDVYEGQWLRDKPHGQGVLLLKDGNRYEGGMKDGKKHGHGRYLYKNKCQVYEGIWVDDTPRCGTVSEYNGRDTHTPEPNPLPPLMLKDAQAVLENAHNRFCSMENPGQQTVMGCGMKNKTGKHTK